MAGGGVGGYKLFKSHRNRLIMPPRYFIGMTIEDFKKLSQEDLLSVLFGEMLKLSEYPAETGGLQTDEVIPIEPVVKKGAFQGETSPFYYGTLREARKQLAFYRKAIYELNLTHTDLSINIYKETIEIKSVGRHRKPGPSGGQA